MENEVNKISKIYKRCQNGTRKNRKTGNCEPYIKMSNRISKKLTKIPTKTPTIENVDIDPNAQQSNIAKSSLIIKTNKKGKTKTPSNAPALRKRCPNGTRKNRKTGNCQPNGMKDTTIENNKSKQKKNTNAPASRKRCPNGTRKNKKTGNCESNVKTTTTHTSPRPNKKDEVQEDEIMTVSLKNLSSITPVVPKEVNSSIFNLDDNSIIQPVVPSIAPVGPSIAPSIAPVGPSIAPSIAPVVPSIAPVVPSIAPVVPSIAPVVPSIAPVVPSIAPVGPSIAPVGPSIAPSIAPVGPSISPVGPSIVPSIAPVGPSIAPVVPSITPAPAISTKIKKKKVKLVVENTTTPLPFVNSLIEPVEDLNPTNEPSKSLPLPKETHIDSITEEYEPLNTFAKTTTKLSTKNSNKKKKLIIIKNDSSPPPSITASSINNFSLNEMDEILNSVNNKSGTFTPGSIIQSEDFENTSFLREPYDSIKEPNTEDIYNGEDTSTSGNIIVSNDNSSSSTENIKEGETPPENIKEGETPPQTDLFGILPTITSTPKIEEFTKELEKQGLVDETNEFKKFKELYEYRTNETSVPDNFPFLYPDLNDPNFNTKIAKRKEFNEFHYDGKIYDIKKQSELLCNADFELSPHQIFVKNFLSLQTPYNSLLLYHGLGTGKTCTSIGITEEYRKYMKQIGLTQRIIVIASPNVQDNFRLQLFDETKLKLKNGIWNIRSCVGNSLLKEINPSHLNGMTKEKVISSVKMVIQTHYSFMGYIEFSNYASKKINAIPEYIIKDKERQIYRIKNIKKAFNNTLILVDEVHNIRLVDDNKNRSIAKFLFQIAEYSDNLRLLLLSATPMYNSYREIIWLVNLLNVNDNRSQIKITDVFNKSGEFKEVVNDPAASTPKGDLWKEDGKSLLIRKLTGYVSYVRSENPYSFPFRVYKTQPVNKPPKFQINEKPIDSPIKYVPLYYTNVGTVQEKAYNMIVDFLKKEQLIDDEEYNTEIPETSQFSLRGGVGNDGVNTDSTNSSIDPTNSSIDPTNSSIDPTNSSSDPTNSSSDPTNSSSDPTKSGEHGIADELKNITSITNSSEHIDSIESIMGDKDETKKDDIAVNNLSIKTINIEKPQLQVSQNNSSPYVVIQRNKLPSKINPSLKPLYINQSLFAPPPPPTIETINPFPPPPPTIETINPFPPPPPSVKIPIEPSLKPLYINQGLVPPSPPPVQTSIQTSTQIPLKTTAIESAPLPPPPPLIHPPTAVPTTPVPTTPVPTANLFIEKEKDAANSFLQTNEEGLDAFGYYKLQNPIQCLNIVYPNKIIDTGKIESKEQLNLIIGKKGLDEIMDYQDNSSSTTQPEKFNYNYKPGVLAKYGRIFHRDQLPKYSGKIAKICDIIRKSSKGIIMIYSQYIDGGIIPISLALEEMGITRFGTTSYTKPLFQTPPTDAVDSATMKTHTELKTIDTTAAFHPAKYTIISGDIVFSPNNKEDIKYLTSNENRYGDLVKIVIISKAGAEGLDFRNIRQIHIMESWYNMNRIEQIIGRGVRFLSHCSLSFEERNVEIFLHSSILPNNTEEECADTYIYRMAEKKAVQIGKITRILKETSVDCMINIGQTNFSVDKLNSLIENKTVKIRLSSQGGVESDYIIGDKPFTDMCDYMDNCEYKCYAPPKGEKPVDLDDPSFVADSTTFGLEFISENTGHIIERIRGLFKERPFYTRKNLIQSLNAQKLYPLEQIYSSLTYLIQNKNEYLIDQYDRIGHLVNKGDIYSFQPVELTDENIDIYERNTPLEYRRDKLVVQIPTDFKDNEYTPTNSPAATALAPTATAIDTNNNAPDTTKEPIFSTGEDTSAAAAAPTNTQHISRKKDKVTQIINTLETEYINIISTGIDDIEKVQEKNRTVAMIIRLTKDHLTSVYGIPSETIVKYTIHKLLDSLNFKEKLLILDEVYKHEAATGEGVTNKTTTIEADKEEAPASYSIFSALYPELNRIIYEYFKARYLTGLSPAFVFVDEERNLAIYSQNKESKHWVQEYNTKPYLEQLKRFVVPVDRIAPVFGFIEKGIFKIRDKNNKRNKGFDITQAGKQRSIEILNQFVEVFNRYRGTIAPAAATNNVADYTTENTKNIKQVGICAIVEILARFFKEKAGKSTQEMPVVFLTGEEMGIVRKYIV